MRSDLIPGWKQPPDFCDEICRRYGVNRNGETIWRVRWCSDRFVLFGGYWDESGRFEYKRVRRYGSQQYWILEKYVPSKDFGNPATWAGRTSNSDGYLNQGPFPVDGLYICTHIFKEPLTPTLVYRTVQSVYLGRLATIWTMHDLLLQQADERERESDENFDREWGLIDNPRRGMTFAGGQRLNQDANRIIEKATEIAAATGGQFREATSGFEQIESLEELT
jgi:hypothetical protein